MDTYWMDMYWRDEYDLIWLGVIGWAHYTDDYELLDCACGKWEMEGA